jgi:hypothetical protein
VFGPWAHPAQRIAKYTVVIAYRFHMDPRQIDEWTVTEFDAFAHQCDEFDKQDRKTEREMSSRRPHR